jgi:hypothetical protein
MLRNLSANEGVFHMERSERMKKRVVIAIVLLLSFAVVPSTTRAGQTFHFNGESAFAIFSSTEGCVTTDVIISGMKGRSRTSPQKAETLASAFLTIFRQNTCTFETLLDISGDVQLPAKNFVGSVNSARLRATIDVYERVSNTFFDMVVDVNWSGRGQITRNRGHFHDKAGNCKVTSNANGAQRPAVASGSISDGRTNYAVGQSTSAMLFTDAVVEISINCPPPG